MTGAGETSPERLEKNSHSARCLKALLNGYYNIPYDLSVNNLMNYKNMRKWGDVFFLFHWSHMQNMFGLSLPKRRSDPKLITIFPLGSGSGSCKVVTKQQSS